MSKVLIIYGSTGGNTEMAAEQVAETLRQSFDKAQIGPEANRTGQKNHKVDLKWVGKSLPQDMASADICILACPTYGHGVLEEYFAQFREALKKTSLNGLRCAVIGLGDPKYDAQYHVESAAILEEAIKNAGGTLVCPALRISRSPVPLLDTRIQKWAEELSDFFLD